MLDVSRHFFTKDEVKEYIDQLAEYKMNVFHWHLTDDQGWRIEIKSLPELTEKGAWRAERVGDWWLAHRPILPVFYKEETTSGDGSEIGLGDLSYRLYISPRRRKDIVWGIGPAMMFPTASSDRLGSEKWSAGPTAGIVTQTGDWTLGIVALNVWSFAGDPDRPSVNFLSVTPIFNYKISDTWFIGSARETLANWNADEDSRWLVPLGASIGKAFTVNKHPMAVRVGGHYNVERPMGAPEWEIRISLDCILNRLLSRTRRKRDQ